jgi:hypothetical protein
MVIGGRLGGCEVIVVVVVVGCSSVVVVVVVAAVVVVVVGCSSVVVVACSVVVVAAVVVVQFGGTVIATVEDGPSIGFVVGLVSPGPPVLQPSSACAGAGAELSVLARAVPIPSATPVSATTVPIFRTV